MIAGLLAETWMADTLLTADISIYPSCNVVDVLDTLAAAPCDQPARLDAISTPHAICFDTYGVMLFAIEASGWDLLPQALYMLTAAVSLHAPSSRHHRSGQSSPGLRPALQTQRKWQNCISNVCARVAA
jgi:hypothetical protein